MESAVPPTSTDRNKRTRSLSWVAGLLVGAAVCALCLVDFFWVRPAQQQGQLDRLAVVINSVVTLLAMPGIAVGRLAYIINHHVSPASMARYYGMVSLTCGFFYGFLTWILARRWASRRREDSATGGGHGDDAPGGDVTVVGRRRFLRGAARASAVGGLSLLGGYATFVEPGRVRLRTQPFALPGLPPALEGLKVIHLTDLHLGRFISVAYLAEVVRQCNALRPDLVLLTGDYVHGSGRFIDPVAGIIGGLRPRFGLVGVLGNHDYWEGARHSRRALRRVGVRLVDNDRVWVGPNGLHTTASADAGLCVAGVGDLWEERVDVDAALDGVDPTLPRLLLSHNPDVAELASVRATPHRVDLMLAGHTHGGQVRLPGTRALITPSRHGNKYAHGLVQGPAFPVNVSAGLGLTILPVRFLVPPEIVLLTLTRA